MTKPQSINQLSILYREWAKGFGWTILHSAFLPGRSYPSCNVLDESHHLILKAARGLPSKRSGLSSSPFSLYSTTKPFYKKNKTACSSRYQKWLWSPKCSSPSSWHSIAFMPPPGTTVLSAHGACPWMMEALIVSWLVFQFDHWLCVNILHPRLARMILTIFFFFRTVHFRSLIYYYSHRMPD